MQPTLKSLLAAATLVVGGYAGSTQAAIIESSVADYEPRLTRPTGSNPGEQLAIDTNIDTPTDASTVRVGGQSRFRFTSAFFFPLPTLAPGETIDVAHLQFTQVADPSAITHNIDLNGVGLILASDIVEANDPDATGKIPTINANYGESLYNNADVDLRPGINTLVPRAKIQDNFLVPTDAVTTGQAVRETSAAGDAALLTYVNALYAAGVPEGSYLAITLNADAPPNDAATSRFIFASANDVDAADRPTLTLNVVPEPGGVAVLLLGGLMAAARRGRQRTA